MIPVIQQPEPSGFDTSIRQRGNAFMAANPGTLPNKLPKYWRTAGNDLYAAYKGICAYTCMYFVAPGSIDHFLPKSHYPQLVYEWSNYRLASPQANAYKGDSVDIVDPFIVQEGWFIIDFPSCLIRPAHSVPVTIAAQIEKTISALKLNAEHFAQERCNIIMCLLDGDISLNFVSQRYPFIGMEINRQGGKDALIPIFKRH